MPLGTINAGAVMSTPRTQQIARCVAEAQLIISHYNSNGVLDPNYQSVIQNKLCATLASLMAARPYLAETVSNGTGSPAVFLWDFRQNSDSRPPMATRRNLVATIAHLVTCVQRNAVLCETYLAQQTNLSTKSPT